MSYFFKVGILHSTSFLRAATFSEVLNLAGILSEKGYSAARIFSEELLLQKSYFSIAAAF